MPIRRERDSLRVCRISGNHDSKWHPRRLAPMPSADCLARQSLPSTVDRPPGFRCRVSPRRLRSLSGWRLGFTRRSGLQDDLQPSFLPARARPPFYLPFRRSGLRRTARPPDLPPRPLMAANFTIISSLVRPGRPLYPVLVHRAAAFLHASFRPRLATTSLRFANPSPPSGWIEDLHPRTVDHARHPKRMDARFRAPPDVIVISGGLNYCRR